MNYLIRDLKDMKKNFVNLKEFEFETRNILVEKWILKNIVKLCFSKYL